MNTKPLRDRHIQRRYQTNPNRQAQPHAIKRPVKQTPQQIVGDLVHQFACYCTSLHCIPVYDFDLDETKSHRCKMTLPIFPNLQSVGHGGQTKNEAKANAIVALLAHLEKRKQVGLFVPYVAPSLYRHIQVELRRATALLPDLNPNLNEFLLAERIVTTQQAKKDEKLLYQIHRICNVRIVLLSQASNMMFIYVVGPKSKQEFIQPYVKALFQPDVEQMFNYGEKLFDIFSDDKFLDGVCQRLKVLCDNHMEKCKLFIRGSSVNVQCCYNEFNTLRHEFENTYHRNRKNGHAADRKPVTSTAAMQSARADSKAPSSSAEAKRVDAEANGGDQLPDYSAYDDSVNASMLRVLKTDEDAAKRVTNQDTTVTTTKPLPEVIEVSDDSSESEELQLIQTVEPPVQKKSDSSLLPLVKQMERSMQVRSQPVPQSHPIAPIPQLLPPPPPPPPLPTRSAAPGVLRHIVLDGQNVARNSNDYQRTFSWSRLSNAINYFKNRGHENIVAFLPLYYRDQANKFLSTNDASRERQIRDTLINSRHIAFTPSRYNNGQRLTNYDDRFILQYAADNDGIVVSNDNFRDLQHEPAFHFVITNRILPFATINDTFMPATDPLGRNGPHLDQFLVKTNL